MDYFFFFYNKNMKKVVNYFSLESMVANNYYIKSCDDFKFQIKNEEEKLIFDKTVELFKKANLSKYYNLPTCGYNDEFFLTIDIDKDKVEYFDIFDDINLRYRNLDHLQDYFEISYPDTYVYNRYDYEQSTKCISNIITKDIEYDNTNVEKYTLQNRLAKLKEELFSNAEYGFYIFKDHYSKYIEKNFPEFKIEYNENFIVSVNSKYCENQKNYKELYKFKVYLDSEKINNEDYYLINKLNKEDLGKITIVNRNYKLQSTKELTHFADVELNNMLNLHHSRCVKICDEKGKVVEETEGLKEGIYYLKLDLFKSKTIDAFLKEENTKFEKLTKELDDIIKDKSDYNNKIINFYKKYQNVHSNFIEDYIKNDSLKETNKDYFKLISKFSDFKDKIIGTLSILQFLDDIDSDLKKINITGEQIDKNLFKYNDKSKRIQQIAKKYCENMMKIEHNENEKKDIAQVYHRYKNDNTLNKYCEIFVFNNISKNLNNEFKKKIKELSNKENEYSESLNVNIEYEFDTSKMQYKDFTENDYKTAFEERRKIYGNPMKFKKGENIFDRIFDIMKYINVKDSSKHCFFNYFINDEQIFDYDNTRNIITENTKIKIVPTIISDYNISNYDALTYLQREKFEKEISEKIENAKSEDELINSFISIDKILNYNIFNEWEGVYKEFCKNSKINSYNVDEDLKKNKFKSLGEKVREKYEKFQIAKLDEESKQNLEKLKGLYQSVVDEYEAKINAVKDIDKLKYIKGINNNDLETELKTREYKIESNSTIEHISISNIIKNINKVKNNDELIKTTTTTYVNKILEIYKNKENEFKNAVLQEITGYYNLSVQEMKNKINNSADINSLKNLNYNDKNAITTELENLVKTKDSNLENKKLKYEISININSYVDEIFKEYNTLFKKLSEQSGTKPTPVEEDKDKINETSEIKGTSEITKDKCCTYKKKNLNR